MDMSDSLTSAVILAVGDQMTGQDTALKFPESDKIHYTIFADVTAARLAELRPILVVSPLMCRSFDCLDLAVRLQQLGYQGKLRILAPNVTKPAMIRSEILNTGSTDPQQVV